MKQAKATNGDMRRMREFFQELEEMFRPGRCGLDAIDNEQLGALVTRHWRVNGPGVGASWSRVVYGMEMLLANCTDPNADTLEWRPDIGAWLDSQSRPGIGEVT